MPRLINTDLLKNPLNWLTVFLMLAIFGIFADVIATHYGDLSSSAAAANNGQ